MGQCTYFHLISLTNEFHLKKFISLKAHCGGPVKCRYIVDACCLCEKPHVDHFGGVFWFCFRIYLFMSVWKEELSLFSSLRQHK